MLVSNAARCCWCNG